MKGSTSPGNNDHGLRLRSRVVRDWAASAGVSFVVIQADNQGALQQGVKVTANSTWACHVVSLNRQEKPIK